jgi:hypothetical protein
MGVNLEPAIRWNVERYRGRSLIEVSHSSRRGAAGASGRRAGRAVLAFAALVRRFFLGIEGIPRILSDSFRFRKVAPGSPISELGNPLRVPPRNGAPLRDVRLWAIPAPVCYSDSPTAHSSPIRLGFSLHSGFRPSH